jgi:hypothetical protein
VLLLGICMEIIIITIIKFQQIIVHHNHPNLIILIPSPPEINQKEVILFLEQVSIPVGINKNKKTNGIKV